LEVTDRVAPDYDGEADEEDVLGDSCEVQQ
jgi:hypothetical protein